MSLIECIQDQGPFYQKLKAELENEASVQHELDIAEAKRVDMEQKIQTQKSEINTLSELA